MLAYWYIHSDVFIPYYRNNESVAPNPRNPLEDYTIHCVDIEVGVHCDSLKFKNDKIFLSHNQGIYLYKDILAILSVQHQTIHIYQLDTGYFFSGDILSYHQAQKHCREISIMSMANLKKKTKKLKRFSASKCDVGNWIFSKS